MPDHLISTLGQEATRLRLETLVRLRWLAVAGQGAAVGVVHGLLGFPLPLLACLLVIGTSVLLNLMLMSRFPVSYRLGENTASTLLAFDIVQLAGLLYLTGGLENPFALLLLAPVMISAAPRNSRTAGSIRAAARPPTNTSACSSSTFPTACAGATCPSRPSPRCRAIASWAG